MKREAPRVPAYGTRRTWILTPSKKRAGRALPHLTSLPAAPARTTAMEAQLRETMSGWDMRAGSNWDLHDGALLISVGEEIDGRLSGGGATYCPQNVCLQGPHTRRLGWHFVIHGLVTRGEGDLHKQERRALAAALRDAADLIERPVAG